MSELQPLIDWTCATRRLSPLFDDEADALLARLAMLRQREAALGDAASAPASIGLYGQSRAAKDCLLTTLCGSGDSLPVRVGGRTLDWLSQPDPGHGAARMALRFTPRREDADGDFPLRLRLLSEAELVQVFIDNALSQPAFQPVDAAAIAARLADWRALRQAQPVPGISAREVAGIARFCQQRIPARLQTFSDALWQQMIQLLPWLDLNARAGAWSLLWGEQPDLTRRWLALAQALAQTGYAADVAAPLSLLINSDGQPAAGFLSAGPALGGETLVVPLHGGGPASAVSLPLEDLALLAAELVLPVENGVLPGVDIIDLPPAPETAVGELEATRRRWLLERYRQRLEPDVLLICNATRVRGQIPANARRLVRWSSETQPVRDGALPGLVWAITPGDDRLQNGVNLDESVQRLIEQPGQRWGALQALESGSVRRFIEWLSRAVRPEPRRERLEAIAREIRQQSLQLMQPFRQPAGPSRQEAEAMVRALQGRAAALGDLLESLLPPQEAFEHLLRARPLRDASASALFEDDIDLFAPGDARQPATDAPADRGTLAHGLWMKHLRQWSRSDAAARRFDLSPRLLQQLADVLIVASCRLGLAQALGEAASGERASAARLRAVTGNWLTWLGYADTAPAGRPASSYARGSTLFAPAAVRSGRLTALPERPEHAATRYVYDWLVALFIRATEAPDYRHPLDIPPAARERLAPLLESCAIAR